MKSWVDKNKGFTLIEVLVVIAIIGILSSVVLSSLNGARVKSRDAKRISDLKQIQIALNLYYSDNGHYPLVPYWATSGTTTYDGGTRWVALQTLLSPYLSNLPRDPKSSGSSGPWTNSNYHYAYGSTGQIYDLVAQLEDTNSPYRCAARRWDYHKGEGSILPESSWCGSFSPYMYADH